jgi:hypothetical protein
MSNKMYLVDENDLDIISASSNTYGKMCIDVIKATKPVEYKPKETVIARGKVDYEEDQPYGDNVLIGDVDILSELFDYDGKTIEIIVREVTDTDSLGNNAEPVKQYPEDDPREER